LARKWALIPAGIDVLVTHGPPRGVGDWSGDMVRAGCEDLSAAVRPVRPLLHLFGHIHQDGGCWRHDDICFANVTTWEGERGATVLDIDVRSRRVVEVRVPPADRRAS
jgi:Icc-related predicted phosphoesterase